MERPPRRIALILASGSPRRRLLLRRAGIRFRAVPSNASERSVEKDPRRLVVTLAVRKAVGVARRHPGSAVLGADTVVFCRGEILSKPRSRADAERMIGALNGSWHKVYTGVALALDGGRRLLSGFAVSEVKARRLPPERVREFAGRHMDKAGAYAVQDRRDPFIARIVGARDNVVGLPVKLVRKLWRRAFPKLPIASRPGTRPVKRREG